MSNTPEQIFIFSCSGASDVGQVTNQAARRLTKEKTGKMFCTAGIGGHVEPLLEKTRKAKKIVAMDGCPMRCARAVLEKEGFTPDIYIELSELGIQKSTSYDAEPKEEDVARIMDMVRQGLS